MKGFAIDCGFLELNISKSFSFRLEAKQRLCPMTLLQLGNHKRVTSCFLAVLEWKILAAEASFLPM